MTKIDKNRYWLFNLRKKRGYSQEDIAKKINIDRTYYSRIENGERKPSKQISDKIAEILKFHPSIFMMEDNPFYYALENSPMIIAHCDLDLRYTWIFNPHTDFDPNTVIGKRDDEIKVNTGTLALMALKQDVIETKKSIRRDISFPLSDTSHVYDVFAQPLFDNNGDIIGVATASTDRTN
ncbi:helix-turn-helix domain-containing protein [Bacillus sp. 31A1R]|uniref:Helix-turn-helix domain-containing protein n=1 Tax=Robertmurraya mangrovi TaxID=3098077 RepID=A0ABU5IWE5_9BACI|nr:helix-turn-helix domain-containing protein [Bacillus sp. 31A1R]MDZ5471484.1 helix-turn-helix domain-containing protein [Bacillus sp. 31A1R]